MRESPKDKLRKHLHKKEKKWKSGNRLNYAKNYVTIGINPNLPNYSN